MTRMGECYRLRRELYKIKTKLKFMKSIELPEAGLISVRMMYNAAVVRYNLEKYFWMPSLKHIPIRTPLKKKMLGWLRR